MQLDQADVRVEPANTVSEAGRQPGARRDAGRGLDRSRGGYDIQADETVSLRLDVRGLDSQEAIAALDRFLDRAILQGAPVTQIIHGKGTGVLRRGIQAFLAQHPRVASYRLGEHGEGGSGVTIVQLD
jgi:dsDNA-specific endonuclease/ATPase MutS2